jgi:hypothetical protein
MFLNLSLATPCTKAFLHTSTYCLLHVPWVANLQVLLADLIFIVLFTQLSVPGDPEMQQLLERVNF